MSTTSYPITNPENRPELPRPLHERRHTVEQGVSSLSNTLKRGYGIDIEAHMSSSQQSDTLQMPKEQGVGSAMVDFVHTNDFQDAARRAVEEAHHGN